VAFLINYRSCKDWRLGARTRHIADGRSFRYATSVCGRFDPSYPGSKAPSISTYQLPAIAIGDGALHRDQAPTPPSGVRLHY